MVIHHIGIKNEVLGQYRRFTPAMKMGLTSTQLEWRDLIVAPITENA